MSAYYNENDPMAAAWIRELIKRNLIAPGVVDERSITEIKSHELIGYTQCHFFAGVAGWSLALRLAGVSDDTAIWTGSCPCQPFSVAGEGKGTEDERHLWPVFFRLISECKPPLVFGEQVASAAVLGSAAKPTKRNADKPIQPVWLDGVFADLEDAGYSCGATDIPAAGIGAPHIRQRCYWGAVRMADSIKQGLEGHGWNVHDRNQPGRIRADQAGPVGASCDSGWLRVSFAADCLGGDGEELGYECSICGLDYTDDCQCHGPTQGDEFEYERFGDTFYAKRLGNPESGGLGIIRDAALAGSGGYAHGSGDDGGMGHTECPRRTETGMRSEIDSGRELEPGRACGGMADSDSGGLGEHVQCDSQTSRPELEAPRGDDFGGCRDTLWMADASSTRCDGTIENPEGDSRDETRMQLPCAGVEDGRVADSHGLDDDRAGSRASDDCGKLGCEGELRGCEDFWSDSYWHFCRDGKYRRIPTQSVHEFMVNGVSEDVGSGWSDCSEEIQELAEALQAFPLASPEGFKVKPRGSVRPGLLKGSGNAIVPALAAEFVKAFKESI
jgi:hypothetical protein